MDTNRPPSFRKLMTFRLHMVARLSEKISEDYYRQKFDLTLPQCRVIGITAGYGARSFKQIADEAYLEKSYASRVVASLVERRLITKENNPADSRSVLLSLTEEGRTVHREMYKAAVQLNQRLQSPFSSSEARAFLPFLATLEDQLMLVSKSLHNEYVEEAPDSAANGQAEAGEDDVIVLDRTTAARLHALLSQHFDDID